MLESLKQENLVVLDNTVNNLYDDDGIEYLILDIEKVTSISSSGLGLLINLTQLPGAQNGIRLINVQNKFKVLFELLGLGDKLKIIDTKETAVNSWS